MNPPKFPGEGLQVANFDHCLQIVIVIGKCTNVFRGTFSRWGGGVLVKRVVYVGGSFHGGVYHEGREFP